MITEDYVSFEVAKLLREKGFNEECEYFYDEYKDENKYVICSNGYSTYNDDKHPTYYSRPTHQMAMKWLRNIHGIHIQAWCPVVDIDTEILGVKYNVVISNLKDYCLAFMTNIEDNDYDSYEEAVDAGLKYTLEHLL